MDKTIKELNLEDDFLFAKVMSDPYICKELIETILEVEIEKVEMPEEQKVINLLLDSKGIRLDVYVKDENNTIYNVEMQRGKKKNLSKRFRYYQGNIDLDCISKGEDYDKLQRSYVIFICTFDLFNKGRCKYTFENVCLEDNSIKLCDDTQKIVLNTKGLLNDVGKELNEFLKYVENSNDEIANKSVKDIHERVIKVKNSIDMEVEYMTLLERDKEKIQEGKEIGIQEGKEIGIQEGKEVGIELTKKIFKLSMSGCSISQIAKECNISEAEVKDILK